MALVVFIMSILSEAFVTGLEAFRHLKSIGDLSERLRTAASTLRADQLAAHFDTQRFIEDTIRTGQPDTGAATALRRMYVALAEDAAELDDGLREVGRQTTNPIARRLLARLLDLLAGIRIGAETMVDLLDLINPSPPPPPSDL